MQESNHADREGLTKTDRLIALTDGLFATVLTVLVLQIGAPGLNTDWSIGQYYTYLTQISSSSLLSYVLTFLVAGSYWQAHHRYYDHIPITDERLTWFNLMFLLCVGLLPFSTNLVGDKFNTVTWSTYCINMVLVGVMFTGECAYAATHHLVSGEPEPKWASHFIVRSLVTPVIFLASLLVAQFALRVAGFFPLLIIVGRIVVNRIIPSESPVLMREILPRGNNLREVLWNIAVFSPLILFAYWLIWISNHPSASR